MSDTGFTVGLTAGSAFDRSIEEAVFADLDVTLRPVDARSSAELSERLAGVDAVIDRLLSAPYTAEVLDALDRCRIVVRCGIGVDEIDVEASTRNGTYVANVPSYCEDEVSDHTLMLILALERDLLRYAEETRAGRWNRRTTTAEVYRLRGRTLGLVGFGTIARLVAEKARGFGMDVVAVDPYVEADAMADRGVEKRDFEEVLEAADVVSVHVPLTDDTRGTFDADAFARMKPSALFVNVARGGLVVEEDLAAALDAGEIRGAGLDVFPDEPADHFDDPPPPFESPLRGRDDAILTPHVAWYSREASDEKRRKGAEEVRRVLLGGEPKNAVNDPT
ncbi:C-terminal binding protein [Halomarina pelagica]|uniref:C-terminal binding protein n=1 Tax=Halomarina pelagica TaxID=2961599 RepID=UPI0020C2ED31|nr:C-terminal binding protein [Halomarina sp. BND7]